MIRTDSRKVRPGDTFVALDGIKGNGADYIDSAVAKGAARIVCKTGTCLNEAANAEVIHVPDTRAYLEEILVKEYGDIVAGMTLIGVTGTNGKTTTCHLISRLLNDMGMKCACIGTIGFFMGEKIRDLPNTSVDICDLYGLLIEAREAGFDYVVLEASSQGLDMGRLNTVKFDIAVFTNLTEDHLDYHMTMEDYARAKQRLFEKVREGGSLIINGDDPYTDYFLPREMSARGCRTAPGSKVITYGFGDFDYKIKDFGGTELTSLKYEYRGREHTLNVRLIGRHNMYNLIACIAAAKELGNADEDIAAAAKNLVPPDGRMERILHKGANIVIDYAHTSDAMEKIIETTRTFTEGNIYVVFGCTGDREREKRPIMTQIALQGSAFAIITVDDIHGEDPEQIFGDMLEGNTLNNYEVCPDRRKAIEKGMALLREGDTLLILGKGHEMFIAVDTGDIPHNDKQAVLEIIAGNTEG
ncbi:MAG: UDP-N-acetylmuramoyl-L-alanyl-D-glutamate--2,6-diaminopimelate ligase [Lachnospiraceae bacterium]|jgi:UDP-N-acetylmuramoyl-L-alanyl-D-glutamate--2,6-diaminopimelate ligase